MLQLPSDYGASADGGVGDAGATAGGHSISFGFDRRSASEQTVTETSTAATETDAQLAELSAHASRLAVELTVLVKMLRSSVEDACRATAAHAKVQMAQAHELATVTDANLVVGKALVERTLGLSLELQDVHVVQARVKELDKALTLYERLARRLLAQQRRSQSS